MERRAVSVRGIVQGVGFRPFVLGLARRFELGGFVCNQTGIVSIEVEGERVSLERFLGELERSAPPLAQIDGMSWEPLEPQGERSFRIESSRKSAAADVFLSPDIATCPDCLSELGDPADRRFGYPFINCTNCGPRLTIITGVPYDRPQTTLASFPMCHDCRQEYEDAGNRRFHAQPIACPHCGPRLGLIDSIGGSAGPRNPLDDFAAAIRAGRIGAMKGLGGYHLLCDARDKTGVAELRRRKHRDEKPFAVIVRDAATAAALCELGDAERHLLTSRSGPIVLLRKRSPCAVADAVAPGNPWLGIMLPYTPLHHLLLKATGIPLVMTSGNRSDEPIAFRDEDAVARLSGIADVFLTHDRPIHIRCDDSVTRIVDGIESPIRRSRGYAPQPLRLPVECASPILAVGGQLKATFTFGRGRHAFVSHHIGDLDQLEAFRAFENEIAHYQRLIGVRPKMVAHDMHPDYASTRYALERTADDGIELVPVQHHHAHLASCMAENKLAEPTIGVTFDGSGYGTDGKVWGGEFLVGDMQAVRRAAHLRYVGLPGSDQAVREPWRMALTHLTDAGCDDSRVTRRRHSREVQAIKTLLRRRLNTPETSSMGRLFDAVACIAGGRDRVSYEGQAAVELEWLATDVRPDGRYPFELTREDDRSVESTTVIDTRPLICAVAEDAASGVPRECIARRFHSTVVELVTTVCERLRAETGLEAVALSGGVFANALLTSETIAALREKAFRVFRHRLVPPNDGGLSLGQLAVAAARTGCCKTEILHAERADLPKRIDQDNGL